MGLGIGLSFLLYFLNIVSNITEEAEFLKYLTPFAYTDGGNIIENSALDIKFLLIGAAFSVAGVALAFIKYRKKDIT